MIAAVASTSSTKAMWYLTRGSGLVALLLLTATLVIGVVEWRRWAPGGWPRFVIDAVHRNLSLLSLVFLAFHIVTSLLDGFAPISIVDVFVPFTGTYRPFWLGLGALALDLMVAIAVTSALRLRLGHRTWRATHWLAYACWPVALMHSVGTGTDTKTSWMLIVSGLCLLAVVVAVWMRAIDGWPSHAGLRGSALAVSVIAPLALIVWLPSGPLGSGWARRSGTPASLLGSSVAVASRAPATRSSAVGGAGAVSVPAVLRTPFSASIAGSSTQGPAGSRAGEVAVQLDLVLSGGRRMQVIMDGQPLAAGGISLTASRVTLGTAGRPHLYSGRVTSLAGSRVQTTLVRAGASALALTLDVGIDPNSGQVTGTATATPAAGGG